MTDLIFETDGTELRLGDHEETINFSIIGRPDGAESAALCTADIKRQLL